MLRGIRIAGLAAVLIVLVLPSVGSAESRSGVAPVGRLGSGLVAQINALRIAHGLVPLRLSPSLRAAANVHSTQMARLGYFSHDSANGGSFSSRIATFYPARGYRSWTVGENLLWASPDVGALRALKMWLASPPHRRNLLTPSWDELGVGVVRADGASGVYPTDEPVFVVATEFGARIR